MMRVIAALLLALLLFPAAGNASDQPGVPPAPKRPASLYGSGWGAPITNREVQWLVGWRYYIGKNVRQDYAAAMKWWLRAAKQGDARAACKIGMMYYTGKGIAQDYAEAYFWFSIVAKYQSGDLICPEAAWDDAGQHLTAEQITALKQRVHDWKPFPEQQLNPW